MTTVAAVLGALVAIWTIASHFDKRNADRFDALQKQIDSGRDTLQKQIDSTRDTLQKQIDSTREVLRAEMREMRADLRLEIKESADRRIIK